MSVAYFALSVNILEASRQQEQLHSSIYLLTSEEVRQREKKSNETKAQLHHMMAIIIAHKCLPFPTAFSNKFTQCFVPKPPASEGKKAEEASIEEQEEQIMEITISILEVSKGEECMKTSEDLGDAWEEKKPQPFAMEKSAACSPWKPQGWHATTVTGIT